MAATTSLAVALVVVVLVVVTLLVPGRDGRAPVVGVDREGPLGLSDVVGRDCADVPALHPATISSAVTTSGTALAITPR